MGTINWPVHPGLAPWVDSVVGYDYTLAPDAVHHGLPSGWLTLILSFDEPLDCGWLGGTDAARGRYWLLAGGLHTRPALIRTHGRQHGIQVALSPWGARALLGVPAAELAGRLIHHEDLPHGFGLSGTDHEQMAELDWPARFRFVETLLLRRAAGDAPADSPELQQAWRALRAGRGAARIEQVAADVGWSRRHLAGRFRTVLGVTPREVGRIARFEYAKALVEAGVSLAQVAADAGYSDQPHLSREFREIAGQSPSSVRHELTEVFPNIQDPAEH